MTSLYDGKKRTAKQWKQLQEKQAQTQEVRKERSQAGLCSECKQGAFQLKFVNRDLVRVCKNCGTEKIV